MLGKVDSTRSTRERDTQASIKNIELHEWWGRGTAMTVYSFSEAENEQLENRIMW